MSGNSLGDHLEDHPVKLRTALPPRAGARSTRNGRKIKTSRPISAIPDSTKTNAPEALTLAGEEAPGAPEVDMVQLLEARGKTTGNGARARRRAERAIAAGRVPGKPGNPGGVGMGRPELDPDGPFAAVGAELRRVRHAGGLTQGALAAALGVRPSYIAKVERGLIGASAEWVEVAVRACGLRGAAVFDVVAACERMAFLARAREMLGADPRHRSWMLEALAGSAP